MVSISALEQTRKTLFGNGRGKTLVAIAGGWFLSIGVRMIYPVMLPYLRRAYGLDLTMAGFLMTVLFLGYAVGQLPGGILADRVGEGTIMIASTVLAAGTLTLVVTARSMPILFGATVLLGFGTGLYAVARFTALADLYPEHVGTSIGIVNAASDAGQSVLPPIASLIAAAVAWQYGLGFVVPLFVLVAIGLRLAVPARTSAASSAVDALTLETARYVLSELRRRTVVYQTVILILGIIIWGSFTGFYPTYLIEVKGFTQTTAGSLFGLFFGLGIIVKPLSGGAYDTLGVRRSLVAFVGVAGTALFALPFAEGFWTLAAITVFVSPLLGFGTIVLSHLSHAFPDDMQGTGLGVVRTIYWGIGAMSPVLFGAVADRGYFDEAFLSLAMIAGLMIAVTVWVAEG